MIERNHMQNANPFFTLTSRDTELVGSRRLADPLGLLPIWSRVARELVPHLTAQTTQAAGFELLIVLLDAFERPEMEGVRQAVSRRGFFLLAEQLAAHSVAAIDNGAWPLPGRRGVAHCMRTGEYPLSLSVPVLLDNQAAGGLWGLYRGAAGRAGLLDATLEAPAEGVDAWLAARGTRLDSRALKELRTRIEEVAGADDLTVRTLTHDSLRRSHLARSLAKLVRELPNRAMLYRHLFAGKALLTKVARRLAKNQDGVDLAAFLQDCRTRYPDGEMIFDEILNCERYIAVLEVVFERLLACSGQTLAQASRSLGVDMKALRAARARFGGLERYFAGGPMAHRFATLRDLDLTDAESFATSLMHAHHAVADQRHGTRWLDRENGRLQRIAALDAADEPDKQPQAGLWRNDYYLPAARSLYRQVAP